MIGVPFALLKTRKVGKAKMNPLSYPALDLLHRGRELAAKRLATMGNSRQLRTNGKVFQPYQEFLEQTQKDQHLGRCETILPPRRIAELGLKFTSILTVLEGKRQPDLLEVMLGLELAKRTALKRHRVLQEALAHSADRDAQPHLEGLSSRERAVFLRVLERNGLTKTELARSFNRMRKDERDEILANLCSRRLLKLKDGNVIAAVA